MTGYARSYLLAATYRHLITGLLCILVLPGWGDLLGLATVRGVLPLQAWGVLFLFVAVPAAYSVLRGCDGAAHLALVLSVALSLAWGVCMVYASTRGPSLAPLVAVAESSWVWKDLTIARQRLRAPLDEVVKGLAPPPDRFDLPSDRDG